MADVANGSPSHSAENPDQETDLDFQFDFSAEHQSPILVSTTTRAANKNSTPAHTRLDQSNKHDTAPSVKPESSSADTANTNADPEKLYQVAYRPASKLPPTGALVASSLASAIQYALQKFVETNGPVDEYVMQALGKTPEDLGKSFSAEQVDAIALCLDAVLRGDEPILCDVTGFGKGRVLAAVGMALMRLGHNLIFITQSSNLFTDFWRDVRNVGGEADYGQPFIMNSDNDSRIIDMNERQPDGRPIIIHKHSKVRMSQLAESGWPTNRPHILMMTYSQINRKESEKSKLAQGLASKAFVLCDESHNAVTTAHSAINTRDIKMMAMGRISASATYARDIHQMATYSNTMPWLAIMDGVSGIHLKSLNGPAKRAVEEASATRAARDGLLIRREHDMTDVVMEAIDATDKIGVDRSKSIEEKFSQIARLLAKVWKSTNYIAKNLPKDNYPSARAANFGGAYALLNRQFSLAMMLPVAASQAADIALSGERYVGIIDSTQESLLKMISDARLDADLMEGIKISERPTFRDAMKVTLNRLRLINYKSDDGLALLADDRPIQEAVHKALALIDEFDELPISPLDYMKREIEARGQKLYEAGKIPLPWRVGEISGRNLSLFDDGRIGPYIAQPRGDVIYAFNNGGEQEITHMLLTRAAAVGMSIHDSVENRISAPRHMQEIQPPTNVVDRAQIWGRIGRRGTRTRPKYSALYLSMPGDIYTVVSQAKKISRISAVVSGSSETLRMLQNMPDPVDRAGDIAAMGLLNDNPAVARALMIGVEDDDEESQDSSEFSNIYPILRRIRLLPFDRQRHVFDMLMERREEVLSAFPSEQPVLSGLWTEISRREIDPGLNGAEPLSVCVYESERVKPPIESSRLRGIIKALLPKQVKPQERRDIITKAATSDLNDLAKKNGFKTAQDALHAPGMNPIKERRLLIKAMLAITDMTPGEAINVPAEHGEKNTAILVSIILRDKTQPLLPRAYKIDYVRPGDDVVKTISLERLIKADCGPIAVDTSQVKMADMFDQAVAQSRKIKKTIITGDPVDEVMASLRLGGGTRSNFMVMQDGVIQWRHGVAIPQHLVSSIENISCRISDVDTAIRAMKMGFPINTSLRRNGENGISFAYDHRRLGHTIDGYTAEQRAFEAAIKIAGITKSMASQDHTGLLFVQKQGDIEIILERLMGAGIPMFADGRFRKGIDISKKFNRLQKIAEDMVVVNYATR